MLSLHFPIMMTGALAVALVPAAALSQQDRPVGAMADDIQKGGEGKVDLFPSSKGGTADPAKPFKPDLLIVPIPQSSPTLGAGITLAGVYFYNPNDAPQPWVSGLGVMYTKNKSKGIAAFHSMSLGHDKFRALAFVGYADVNLDFYGIGPQAGARGVSVDINDKGAMAILQAQYSLFPYFYAGGRFQYLNVKSSILIPNPIFPDLDLPKPELDSKISAVGPAFTYDTRNNNSYPTKGALITLVTMFNLKDLGSDFSYQKLTFAANGYIPVASGTTIGVRASVCGVSKGGPFYDLCMYGMGNDLRGYETGRYRDRAFWAVQAELRQHLFGAFGAVVFGGLGGTMPDLGSFGDTTFLPSVGVGLRYRASKATGTNLHLDYAIGRDSHALYFGIAEAF